VVAVLLAGTTLIGACGGSSKSATTAKTTHLNTTRVATSIEQSIFKQRHLHATVACPAVVVQQPGMNFVCVATMRKGGKTSFAVTQGPNGYVTYQGE
jgi:tagatose-1,6-bisphosphate aldolase non-catalytic subunit AgaZ/GatZ